MLDSRASRLRLSLSASMEQEGERRSKKLKRCQPMDGVVPSATKRQRPRHRLHTIGADVVVSMTTTTTTSAAAAPATITDLISLLPDECTQSIFAFLPSARDRCACSAVCKRWLVLLAHMRGCEFNSFRFVRNKLTTIAVASAATDHKDTAPHHHQSMKEVASDEASRCLEAKEANDARLAAMAVGTYGRRLLGKLSVRGGSPSSLSQQQRITDFGLHIVSQSFPNLRSLSLWDCFRIGSTGLASIAQCCRALEKLDISNSPGIDDDGLVPIARNCLNLSALSIDSCPRVGDRSLLALARCSSHLQSISIAKCPQVGDAGVVSVVSRLPGLTRIRLAQLRLGDASLEAIGRHRSGSIRMLQLENITGLTMAGFSWIAQATRLEFLSLNACHGLTESGPPWAAGGETVSSMVPAFRVLKQINIKRCGGLRDEGLMSLTKAAEHLETLKLERCDAISTEGIMGAMRNCSRTLKVLSLVKCNTIGGTPSTSMQDNHHCPSQRQASDGEESRGHPLLDSLTLKSCTGVDDAFLSRLAPVCMQVRHIGLVGLNCITDRGLFALLRWTAAPSRDKAAARVSLSGCGRITDWSVVALARAFGTRLESLSLEGCGEVGDRSLEVVGEVCTGLTELDVSGSRISDGGLARLAAAKHQSLEVLSVAGCKGITDRGLGCLEVMCGGLVGLNLQHCQGVSREGVEAFRAALWWCDLIC